MALVFVTLIVVRRIVLRGSAHFTGATRVLVVVVALLAVAGIRLLASRR